VLTCWQAEMPEVPDRPHPSQRAVRRARQGGQHRPTSAASSVPMADPRRVRATATAPVSANHDALGGSPLDHA
jgi:chromosomal replication initiator protein